LHLEDMMTVEWHAELIALGREGLSWPEVSERLGRDKRIVAATFSQAASAEDKAARSSALQARGERRGRRTSGATPPSSGGTIGDARFSDDAAAERDRGSPRADRPEVQSLTGCATGMIG